MPTQENFSHAATIFRVNDLKRSIDFYVKQLEFELAFEWGEPTAYAVLKKGGVSIHLTQKNDDRAPSIEHCALYIFVHDIDQIYQRCVEAEVTILNAPATRDYAMKDFDIQDPDGYIITFGKGS